jgi:hypothetical protein
MSVPPASSVGRLAFLAIGVAAIAGAFWIPTRAVEDGGRTLGGWIVATAGIAIVVRRLGGPEWTTVAGLTSILIIGVMGQLGITDPLWLQHLRISPSESGGFTNLFLLFCVAVQAVCVLGFSTLNTTPLRSLLPGGWRSRIRWHHWLLGGVLFVASAVHLTRYVDKAQFAALSYGAQLFATALLVAIDLLNLVLVFISVPVEAVRAVRERFARLDLERALPWILAAWVLAASLLLGFFALDFVPHIPDELSYVFQAECLARGVLWGKAPPSPESFEVYLVTVAGDRWFATTPPGWPAVLAVGAAVGAPWIVNPLLGALSIPLAHALTRRLLGRKAAHVAAFLLAVSPWLLYLSASYMTHPLSLFLMLAAWLCLAKSKDAAGAEGGGAARAGLWSLAGGSLLGWLALVRQLDAVLVALVLALWMLGLFGKRMPWTAIAAFGAGFVAVAALILPYNAAMTGDPARFPINAYLDALWYPGANRLGFGADVGNPPGGWGDLDAFPGHGLRDVLVNTNQNLYATNFELFGWCIGSFFFAALHVFFGTKSAIDRLAIFAIAVLLLGYHLYWFSGGPDFGARYWYLMIYPLVLLTVRGLETATAALQRGSAGDTAPERMAVVVAVLTLVTLAVFLPWRAVARYKDYRGFHADYGTLALEPRSLVFVKSARRSDFWSAFIRNSPDQTEPRPIFAEDRGDAVNAKMIAAFPDRTVYFVEGRSSTKDRTRVTEVRPPAK